MLEVPDVFTMLVPDGWAASQSGRTYELTHGDDDCAAHVSVYDRAESPLGADEAEDVLKRFIATVGADAGVDVRVLRETDKQHRAVARFAVESDGAVYDWIGFVVLWRDRLLVCSCSALSAAPLLDEAERMFASIFPPKKGRFWRR